MIETIRIPKVNYMTQGTTEAIATNAFMDAINDEVLSLPNYILDMDDTVYGKVYNETRRIYREHAKGCDCVDCLRIEQ